MTDYEHIFEQSSVLVAVIDENGSIRYVNTAIDELCGYEAANLVDTSFHEWIHPDDQDLIEQLLSPRDEGTQHTDFEFRIRNADGSWIWLIAIDHLRYQDSGELVMLMAIDAENRQELKRKIDRFEVILDSIKDGVYAIKPDGTIVYVNEAYAGMKGVERSDMIGTNIYSWGSPKAAREISDVRDEVIAGKHATGMVEFEFTQVDGPPIPVELYFGSVDRPDEEVERVGVMRDVSERKRREEELFRKNQRLQEFASIVSHDLRNPLNVAQGRLELATETGDGEHIVRARDALDRMHHLIEDLLTLARQGEQVQEFDVVPLHTLCNDCWDNVETKSAELNIELERTLSADRSRLQQMIENLFRNAIEHGGADVTITIGELPDGFFIEDDGEGIPPAHRKEIFETGHSTSPEGTGFGLSIVQQITDAHGWSIAATEGETGGARFEITGVEFID